MFHPVPPPLQSGKSHFPHHRGFSEDRIARKKSYKADVCCFLHSFFSFFLMFAVFRLLPPQGGESVAPYQAFGAHPLMQITEALHIMHCSKSMYTNITPFFPTLQADPSDSANDTKRPRLPVMETGDAAVLWETPQALQSLSAAGS
ncbi:hypothetical protein L0N24_11820 [Faecalibacterium prausnitzii]|uniref:hypothetical protein n=1 Tax=Faecalibacterium prausnitzii TaxID=853 RepID=UPI001EDE360D|nr:hypothetical protein [Faecalibacterium prausnitzii]MCG4604194.1 hypothetical protein [Faecalibacterium prausnitzii]